MYIHIYIIELYTYIYTIYIILYNINLLTKRDAEGNVKILFPLHKLPSAKSNLAMGNHPVYR